jgi:hypothetical protein
MALQRTRRPRLRSGRSLCSLGSPLNARSLGLAFGRIAVRLPLILATFLYVSEARAAEPVVSLPGDMVVTLTRGACYGQCPQYELTVFESGKVVFIPVRNVKARRKALWAIDRAAVSELRRRFDQVGVLALQGQYEAVDDPACPEWTTDHATVHLTVHHNGSWKFIRHYLGCRGSSDVIELQGLEEAIDRIAKADRAIR